MIQMPDVRLTHSVPGISKCSEAAPTKQAIGNRALLQKSMTGPCILSPIRAVTEVSASRPCSPE